MLRTALSATTLAVSLSLLASASAFAQDQRIERQFLSGGSVDLELAAGDYTITASPDDRIRVQWRTNRPDDADDADVDVQIKGSHARIETDGPLRDGMTVRIELPRRTHIVARLSAGELRLSGIEGSKDVEARAGELTIATGGPEHYRRVDASVRIGELSASPFKVDTGGFFRSFTWNGKGPYDLHAHLTVGELRLTP